MSKIKKIIYNHFYILLLAVLVSVIAMQNFQLNTWFTGWDNLHPELNFALNLKRSVFGVWQEYQGLGLLAGMGHASDFVRQVILAVFSFFIPIIYLRALYVFLMLFLGPLGIYFLITYLYAKKEKIKLAAFLASLFYLLNLATVQIFYTPFEPFVTHFSFLPWLLLVFVKFVKKPNKKNLAWFLLINLLSLPQAYVPTMFFVYIAILGLFFIGWLLTSGEKKLLIKRFTQSLFFIFILNAFWLLPFLYFTVTNIENPLQSHNNFMSTEAIYLKNKKFGNLENTVILKNFWFDYVELSDNKYQYLVGGWRQHLGNPFILYLGYGFFVLVLIGAIYAVLKKPKYWLSFLSLFIFSFAVLANDMLPFSFFDSLWRKVPILSQVFRVPFTKFGNLALFSYTMLLSFSIFWLVSLISRLRGKIGKVILVMASLVFTVSLFTYSLPIFKQNLIDDQLKQDIPYKYFDLFEFFETVDPNARIANLPQPSFWGWNYYLWGYHGSGFLWYGIKPPILDRAFDVWSQANENYFWEINQAIYSSDLKAIETVLEKYQISYLILDKDIRNNPVYKTLYIDEIEAMLQASENIKLVRDLHSLLVFEYELKIPAKDYVFFASGLPKVNQYYWNNQDTAFNQIRNYISLDNQSQESYDLYYPFRSLFTGRKQEELEFELKQEDDFFIFSKKLPENLNLSALILPSLNDNEVISFTNDLEQEKVATPEAKLANNRLEIKIEKQSGYYSYDSFVDDYIYTSPANSCDPFNQQEYKKEVLEEDNKKIIRLISQSSSNCLEINLPHLSQKTGYLVKVQSRNIKGSPLLFYIINNTSKNRIMETYLEKNSQTATDYYLIPPMEEYGIGYSLNFDNMSIGRQEVINDLVRVELYPISYQFLKAIKLESEDQFTDINNLLNKDFFQVNHSNPSYYKIRLDQNKTDNMPEYLVLSQAYHPGWQAWQGLPFLGNRLENKVLINNWENGWQLKHVDWQAENNYITIIFWPQLLEYLGICLGLGLILSLLLKSLK
jgi:hypothetical protein